jgi:hypothetical protein
MLKGTYVYADVGRLSGVDSRDAIKGTRINLRIPEMYGAYATAKHLNKITAPDLPNGSLTKKTT